MKSVILSLLAVNVILFILATAQSVDSSSEEHKRQLKFDPTRDAFKDIKIAIHLAQESHKRILLDVGGEWCIWCHRLDSLFIQNKDLEEYLNKYYVVVKINVSKENENKEFLLQYPKVAGYPHLFILEGNGKLLHSQDTGELEYPEGYPVKGHDKKKVFAYLRRWAGK